MTFTDDDLKRLKASIDIEEKGVGTPSIGFSREQLEALLARLKAAEAIANYRDDVPHTVPSYLKEAWRKAAGK